MRTVDFSCGSDNTTIQTGEALQGPPSQSPVLQLVDHLILTDVPIYGLSY